MQRWLEDLLNDKVQGELDQAERMSMLKEMQAMSDPHGAQMVPNGANMSSGGPNEVQENGVLSVEEERLVATPNLPTPPRSAVPPVTIESPDSHIIIDGVSISCRVAGGCIRLKSLLKNCMPLFSNSTSHMCFSGTDRNK
eukprot:sb/3474327/